MNTEIEYFECGKNMTLSGLTCVYDEIGSITIELNEQKTKGGGSYVELPINYLQFLSIRLKKERQFGFWRFSAYLRPSDVLLLKIKCFETFLNFSITTGIFSEEG